MRPPKPLIRALGRMQAAVYRWTGGRVGGRFGGAQVLLLTTTGRRTGAARTVPVLYIRDGERYVVVGSQAGHDTHPAWYLNLRARQEATVQVADRTVSVTAHDADSADRERLWPLLVAVYPAWSAYRERTARAFPIVLLTPRPDNDAA